MRLMLLHARAGVIELLRYPSFSLPTLAFPTLIYLSFVSFRATEEEARFYLASTLGFAVFASALFQFGVGIAADRVTPWERFLRVLPVSGLVRLAARVLTALTFALLAAASVAVVALVTTPLVLDAVTWGLLGAALLVGAAPLALLGMGIGYWFTPKGAPAVTNLLFLALSFAGGLWQPPSQLPRAVEVISPALPTRQFGELLWQAVEESTVDLRAAAALTCYSIVFGAIALWGYRRDEGQRYR